MRKKRRDDPGGDADADDSAEGVPHDRPVGVRDDAAAGLGVQADHVDPVALPDQVLVVLALLEGYFTLGRIFSLR